MADLTVDQLIALAQYTLAAAVALKNNRLSPSAQGHFAEWAKANDYTRRIVGEFPISVTATATRRAFGSLLADQLAQGKASGECCALMGASDALKEQLADADWDAAADVLVRNVIADYHAALEFYGRQG